jgi:hypothetical protein
MKGMPFQSEECFEKGVEREIKIIKYNARKGDGGGWQFSGLQ